MAKQEIVLDVHWSRRVYETTRITVELEGDWEITTPMLERHIARLQDGAEDDEIQVDDYEVVDTADDPAFADDAFTEHALEVARGDFDA